LSPQTIIPDALRHHIRPAQWPHPGPEPTDAWAPRVAPLKRHADATPAGYSEAPSDFELPVPSGTDNGRIFRKEINHVQDPEGHEVKRRHLFAVAVAGGAGAVLVGNPAFADSTSLVSPAAVAAAADTTVEPAYGAGLFDVDPDQGNVSQSPSVVVTGDIAAMPEDWSF
jgi:hypothetical protein